MSTKPDTKINTVEEAVLEILENHNGAMPINELGQELRSREALGLGVETRSVVYELKNENKVSYDSKTEIVSAIGSKSAINLK